MPPNGPYNRDLAEASVRILEQVNEAIAILTTDIRVAWVNREFVRLTGYDREEIIGQPLTILRSGLHSKAEYEAMEAAVTSEGRWHGEVWRRKKNGEVFPAWLTISAVYDEQGTITHFVDLFVDIERIRKERENLERLVNYDPLTDLPNRRLFWDRLSSAVHRARRKKARFALVFIDLDEFKEVNDTLGHQAGDRLLVDVARVLKENVRDADTVARLGGDEFVLILEDGVRADQESESVERLRQALDSVWQRLPGHFRCGASLGLAIFPIHGDDPESLYRIADQSMYQQKKQRRRH